jgi:hypothetical protein
LAIRNDEDDLDIVKKIYDKQSARLAKSAQKREEKIKNEASKALVSKFEDPADSKQYEENGERNDSGSKSEIGIAVQTNTELIRKGESTDSEDELASESQNSYAKYEKIFRTVTLNARIKEAPSQIYKNKDFICLELYENKNENEVDNGEDSENQSELTIE